MQFDCFDEDAPIEIGFYVGIFTNYFGFYVGGFANNGHHVYYKFYSNNIDGKALTHSCVTIGPVFS